MRRRRRLVVRLIAVSVLIAVGSIVATAWLAVQTTTRAIQQEQGRALSGDAAIYRDLIRFAATNEKWELIEPTLRTLAASTGRRIVLTTQDRKPVADSGGAASPLPSEPSAVIDPLHADPVLVPDAAPSGIDPRAVGPFQLSNAELGSLQDLATERVYCLRDNGYVATVREAPNGRPRVDFADGSQAKIPPWKCGLIPMDLPTVTEERAIGQLTALTNECLRRQEMPPVRLSLDYTFSSVGGNAQVALKCVDTGRRELLKPFVAPPALLFVASPNGTPATGFTLSEANITRIVLVTVSVLGLTVLISILVATRLTRPLRALTQAAQGNRRAPVTSNDEIGYLAAAFNDLSDRRERTEEQRKIMVGDIAHELRNPLSTMRGQLEAAQDGHLALDERLAESLLEETTLLQHIVDDLQVLAIADAGELRLHPEPVHIADLLNHVTTAYRDRAAIAGVLLTTSVEDDPELIADPVRVRQAVANLLSNAIRHTPPGGTVSVRARAADDHVVIDVIDTGLGIDTEDLPHVFDRFWRTDKSRSRQTGGSGLGLAIVRHLAHAHAGMVTVTSQVGTGSVFTLRLPMA